MASDINKMLVTIKIFKRLCGILDEIVFISLDREITGSEHIEQIFIIIVK